ncbi:MAG: DUF4384 domain-containing protein [Pseudorhodoplanes sp.]|nr:DUF4384 domain-containing protein [Pseudorhodoplanes sp.]
MKRHLRFVSWAAGAWFLLIPGILGNHALAAPAKPADVLDTAIAKLLAGMFGSKPCASDERQTVGLWVFEDDKIPIAAANAKRLHEELLTRLLAARPKCVDVLDSAGIGVIINHLSKSGALEKNGGSLIAALDDAHQNVHLIAFPSLYNQGGKTVLALRAVERTTGKTLALTAPVIVPDRYLSEDASDRATSLDAAIKAASKYFADNAADLRELRPLGVFYEDTAAQPAAGRYLLDQLVAALSKDTSNVLTGKVLKVRALTIEPAPKTDGAIDAQDLEASGSDPSSYDLFGRYWVRGNTVDLRISMKRGDAGTLTWQGKVRTTEFKDLELRPTNPAAALHPLPKGAFAFQVTSPKGPAPIYRPREELTMFLRLGQEASVYCFYIDSNGGVLTVLPNRFSDAESRSNRFAAKVLHRLPDGPRDPFKLIFTANTAGEELIVCFASTRDVRADLPAALFPDQIKVVPFLTLEQLRQLFANLKDSKISEASVTVTVAR